MICFYYITSIKFTFVLHLFTSYIFYNPTVSEAVNLTQETIDTVLVSNELVLINFYANWCRFSQILTPIFDKVADAVNIEFSPGQVVLAKVDCMEEDLLANEFGIIKYPTIKVIQQGKLTKKEYRGHRQEDALFEFIKQQFKDPVIEVQEIDDLRRIDSRRRNFIGLFDHKDVLEYDTFKRIAKNLKDNCQFHAGFGLYKRNGFLDNPIVKSKIHVHPSLDETFLLPLPNKYFVGDMHLANKPTIVFRPDIELSNENDEIFEGSLLDYNDVNNWISEKCFPLVREITYENAEELAEEGLPFLILFYNPNNIDDVKKFKDICETLHGHTKINFIFANGEKFSHPLKHLRKSVSDLPLIAIDSFVHMHLFGNIQDMEKPGKLEQFLNDFYSGELHTQYHYVPEISNILSDAEMEIQLKLETSIAPKSAFKSLGPSNMRYTLLKDEL